jgi:hypothetical protein
MSKKYWLSALAVILIAAVYVQFFSGGRPIAGLRCSGSSNYNSSPGGPQPMIITICEEGYLNNLLQDLGIYDDLVNAYNFISGKKQ